MLTSNGLVLETNKVNYYLYLIGVNVAGVISNYFLPRWKMFIAYANQTLNKHTPFNKTFIKDRIFQEVEEAFTFDRTVFPTQPQGNIK